MQPVGRLHDNYFIRQSLTYVHCVQPVVRLHYNSFIRQCEREYFSLSKWSCVQPDVRLRYVMSVLSKQMNPLHMSVLLFDDFMFPNTSAQSLGVCLCFRVFVFFFFGCCCAPDQIREVFVFT